MQNVLTLISSLNIVFIVTFSLHHKHYQDLKKKEKKKKKHLGTNMQIKKVSI